jgi:hypothetical protein
MAMVGFLQAQNCRDILLHRICLLVALNGLGLLVASATRRPWASYVMRTGTCFLSYQRDSA